MAFANSSITDIIATTIQNGQDLFRVERHCTATFQCLMPRLSGARTLFTFREVFDENSREFFAIDFNIFTANALYLGLGKPKG